MNDVDINNFDAHELKIRDYLISRAKDSINAHVTYSEEKKEDYIKGLAICTQLHSIADFEAVITIRQDEERQHRLKIKKMECYWSHRYATAQIEFIYEHMKVAVGSYGMHKTQSVAAIERIAHLIRPRI